jgi:hypothetical protein
VSVFAPMVARFMISWASWKSIRQVSVSGPWLQAAVVPAIVRHLLHLPAPPIGTHLMSLFCALRPLGLAPAVIRTVIPPRHWKDVKALESPGSLLNPAA